MVERPYDGPLPPAHPVPYGRPPQPDGQTVPQPPRPAAASASWYERARAIAVLVVALAAVVIGALR